MALNERLAKRLRSFNKKIAGGDRLPPTLALISVVLLGAWMGNVGGGYFAAQWVPTAFVLVALLVVISAVGASGVGAHRYVALALALFTGYAAWTFASLLWSPNRGEALFGAGQTFLYLLVFWTAAALVALGASRRGVLAASVLGPAVIAAFTLLALVPRFEYLFENDRLVGTVGYYNGEAAFLLVPFWLAVYLGGSRTVGPLLRGAVLAGAVLSVDLAVLTQSRGAMVAMAASLPVFFLLSGARMRGLLALAPVAAALFVAFPGLNEVYLASAGGGSPAAALESVLPTIWLTAAGAGFYGLLWGLVDGRWRPSVGLFRVAGGGTLACCLVALVVGATVLVERTGDPAAAALQKWESFKADDETGEERSRYLSASGSGRYALWQVAWKDFTAHPVLGVGTQNYEATYYQSREQDAGPARQPHALWLEVLGERGVVGGVLFFGLLATCLAAGLHKRFRGLRSEGKAQVGALVAALAYFLVHSSAEWFWQLPAVTLPAMVYLALLVSPWRRGSERAPEPAGWPMRVAGLGVAALALAILVPLFVSERYMSGSYATGTKEALAAVERAQALNPLNPRLPQREAELASDAGDWGRAEEAYERGIRLDPEHYAPYLFRASYHEQVGDREAALRDYRRAMALNPLDKDLQRRAARLENASAGGA